MGRKLFSLAILSVFFLTARAQVNTTIVGNGDWATPGNWVQTGGNAPATALTDNVEMNNNVSVQVNGSFTIGDLTANNNNGITISSTGNLQIGNSSNLRTLTAGNNTTITVQPGGVLFVYGNLVINNQLTLVVNGTMVVTGNVDLGTTGSITIGGSLTVGGDFTSLNATTVILNPGSSISVAGNVKVGNVSNLINNGGTFTAGTCDPSSPPGFCAGILPVKLLFFKSETSSNSIHLKWATESEINFDYFLVERSLDGTNFNALGSISGHGTSVVRHDYQYLDLVPVIGNNYYRLKSIDFDGYTEYSETIVTQYQGEKLFSVYPVPSDGIELKVLLNFSPSEEAQIVILDNLGNEVGRNTISNLETAFNFPSKLKGGIYLARINSKNFSQIIRFVVN